jgi:hypothetical protein
MADGLVPEFPSESSILEFLLRAPASLGLTSDQLGRLQALSIDLQTRLIDSSSAIRKAELSLTAAGNATASADVERTISDALTAAASARAQAVMAIRSILSAKQFQETTAAISGTAALEPAGKAVAGAGSKDQKVVEIETAAMIAERVLSWAKLFGLAVAFPAALLIGTLTVLGISKYSDFSTLVADSEAKLRKAVTDATNTSDSLAKKVAQLDQQQSANEQKIQSLSRQVESLSFGKDSSLPLDKQKQLQELFAKFQEYLRGLGYVPENREIKFVLHDDKSDKMTGALAYYVDGTIHISLSAANDPDVVYREYLHHVFMSKLGNVDLPLERVALESGLADFFIASYSNRPAIYQKTVPTNLSAPGKLKKVTGYGDTFEVGHIWGSLFWKIRQSLGSELVERELFASWFDLTKDLPDKDVQQTIVTGLYARLSKAGGTKVEPVLLDNFKAYNAPSPKDR